jgi:hypothetical protein
LPGSGQPRVFSTRWANAQDRKEVVLYTGLLLRPYTLLRNPGVRLMSGFFGPVERAAGARVSYLPADFISDGFFDSTSKEPIANRIERSISYSPLLKPCV